MDSHADTTILGRICVILTYTGKEFKVSPYSDKYKSIQNVTVVTGATTGTFPHSGETFILVFNESLWMGEKLYHTLVNPNQMPHHRIDVKDNPCMKKPMGITCPEEDVTVPLYISGKIICADTLSPTHQQLADCLRIVLTSPHDWDPNSVRFPKGSHSKDEEYLFAGIVEICVDALQSKVHENEIEPGLHDTVHDPYFIATRLGSQVRMDNSKVPDATRITDLEDDVFEGRCQ